MVFYLTCKIHSVNLLGRVIHFTCHEFFFNLVQHFTSCMSSGVIAMLATQASGAVLIGQKYSRDGYGLIDDIIAL